MNRFEGMLTSPRLSVVILAVGLLIFFSLNTWGYPLFDVDEPRYAETAREMLTFPGDWITPHFNFVPRFDKPVLFYWLIAAMYKMLGVSEMAARLVSALSATGIGVMLFIEARRHLDVRVAWMSALIFATMLEPFILARWAITDMTLACFMTGLWLSLYNVLTQSVRWYIAAGIFSGLGLLTKGPVAIALPALTFFIMLALPMYRRQWRAVLVTPWLVLALALCLGIALPWYMAVAQANPSEFVDKFIFFHNVQRFVSTVSGHTGSWFYYFPVLLAGAMPWIVFLPGLPFIIQQYKKTIPPLIGYATVWFLTVFLFFSISKTKLLTYVLPLFPAIALIFGWYWSCLLNNEREGQPISRWTFRLGWLMLGIFTAASLIHLVRPYAFVGSLAPALYQPWIVQIMLVAVVAMLALTLRAAFSKQLHRAFVIFLVGTFLLECFTSLWLLPMVCQFGQADMMAVVKSIRGKEVTLATYKVKRPSLVFYTHQPVYFVPLRQESKEKTQTTLQTLFDKRRPVYLVAKNKYLSDLSQAYAVTMRHKGYRYSVVEISPVHQPNKELFACRFPWMPLPV